MKNFKSFFSTFLIFSIVLTNVAIFVLPAFAVEKNDINLEQNKANSLLRIGVGDQVATGTLTETNINKQFGIAENKLKEDISKDTPRLETKNYVEGEILVKYRNNKINLNTSSGRATALSFNTSKSLEKKEDLKKNNISVLRIKDSKTVEQKIAELKNNPNVEYAQPNFQYYPSVVSSNINTNDTFKNNLWGLDNTGQTIKGVTGTNDADIDAPEAWAINEGTNGSIIVAVIDTGVAYNHPDLINNMWDGANCVSDTNTILGGCNHGYDYEDGDKMPLPTTSPHGTHIAGTIAAVKNNNVGIIGVAPNAKIMALKSSLTTVENIKAINFSKYNGAKIINASWGSYGTTNNDQYDSALYNAIKDFPGLFVVAAGNYNYNHDDGTDIHKSYPDGFKITTPIGPGLNNIIVVAATDQNDNLANEVGWASDYGAISVDVGAPGVNIYSTVPAEISTTPLLETFDSLTPPNLPSGWIQTGYWGTYRLDIGTFWGNVLYGDYSHLPYAPNANSIITLPSLDLYGSEKSHINFWTKCDTEYFLTDSNYFWTDYMTLELSSNGTDFTPILSWNEAYIDSNYPDSTGAAMHHFQNIEIPSAYYTSNFKIRFRWKTDSNNLPNINYDGCLIDDLQLVKDTLSDGSDEQYGYMNGTSMAAPHVAGLAALIWGTKPNLTYANVKNTILTTGDDLISLATTTATGKRINSFNALDSVTPPIISNIQVATTTETSTTITWSTDLPATSTVSYSTTTPVSSTIVSGGDTATTSHNIGLTDLSPDTTYYFYTKSSDKYGNIATSSEQSFKTLTSQTSRTISGTIKYYDGIKVVRNATVILEDDIGIQIATTTTDVSGIYQFTGVASGGNYVVRVNKSDDASGLSSNDQIKIGRHIVGLEVFSTIFKTIAGDVNDSGGLTSNDQIKIGRFIVGLDSNLPSGAWKFYSSDAILTTTNYLTLGLTRTYTNLMTDMSNQDFVGIKMGDVNNSWVSN